jgi:outer membrane protein OmpA-like peptidoglycan-associated protein
MMQGQRDGWRGMVLGLAMGLAACGGTKELVVLLPDEAGKTGVLAVSDKDHTIVLDAPLATAKMTAQGRARQKSITQAEVQRTFAPALAARPPETMRFVLYFVRDSTQVVEESQAVLEALFAEVARRQAVEVQVTGHTDRMGELTYNDRLALERAAAVRAMLMQRGLQAHFVRTVGRGEREPLIPTPDEQPEPRNRRVEVLVR